MLDIPPAPDRRTNVPGKLSFKRFFNWARPSLDVAAEQLRPDESHVQLVLGAACDIRLCEDIFDKWGAELDSVSSSSSSGGPDEREQRLRRHLTSLKEDVSWCSRATNAILFRHMMFASLMSWRVDGASKSRQGKMKFGADTTELVASIGAVSDSLHQYVARMRANLAEFVGVLEEVEKKVEKKKKRVFSKWRIWGWLKHLFNALAKICKIGAFILSYVPHVPPGMDLIASVGSTLMSKTAALCGEAKKKHKKESENIKDVIEYLKTTVPKEAQEAQKRLAKFDQALDVMGLEAHMKTGRRVTLFGPDLPAIAQEWNNVADKYQSVLPDDYDDDENQKSAP